MQKSQLNSIRSNTNGFGLTGVLLIVLVLAATAGAGVYAYRRSHKAKTVSTNSSTTKPTPRPVDPYAGWKTYTDTTYRYSFRYPADWTLDTTADQVTVLNPANSLEVDYLNPYVHDSGFLSFDPVFTTDLSVTGLNLKVVGGVYAPANEPDYGVVDSSLLTSYPLTIGRTTQFPNALRFADTHSNDTASAAFRSRATVTLTASQAQAWFASADAKTSLLIIESLAYQR